MLCHIQVDEKFLGEQTCKPSSVPRLCRGGDHPSSPDVAIGVKRPTQRLRPSTLNLAPESQTLEPVEPSYLVLLRVGFVQPTSLLVAGELLPHHFTLARTPMPSGPLAVCFCGTFRRVSPPGRYPAPCSVELGLSSPRTQAGAVTRFTRPLLFYISVRCRSNSSVVCVAVRR